MAEVLAACRRPLADRSPAVARYGSVGTTADRRAFIRQGNKTRGGAYPTSGCTPDGEAGGDFGNVQGRHHAGWSPSLEGMSRRRGPAPFGAFTSNDRSDPRSGPQYILKIYAFSLITNTTHDTTAPGKYSQGKPMTGDAYLNNILIREAVDMGPTSPVWGVQAQLIDSDPKVGRRAAQHGSP